MATVNVSNVSLPGISLPVSGEVDFHPARYSWEDGLEGAEISDARLKLEDGSPLPLLSEEAYARLLEVVEEVYNDFLAEALGENSFEDIEGSLEFGL